MTLDGTKSWIKTKLRHSYFFLFYMNLIKKINIRTDLIKTKTENRIMVLLIFHDSKYSAVIVNTIVK